MKKSDVTGGQLVVMCLCSRWDFKVVRINLGHQKKSGSIINKDFYQYKIMFRSSSLPRWVIDDFLADMWKCDRCRHYFHNIHDLDAHIENVHTRPLRAGSRIVTWYLKRMRIHQQKRDATRCIIQWWRDTRRVEPLYEIL
jgi:hypothetical protein